MIRGSITIRASTTAAPERRHLHRVQLELAHPRQRAHQRRELQQHPHQRLEIGGRELAIGAQVLRRPRAGDQIEREAPAQRRQHHRLLPLDHRVEAAVAESDHGAEHRIGVHADRHLARVPQRDHLLHDEAGGPALPGALLRLVEHLGVGAQQHRARAQVEPRAHDMVRMGDGLRVQLQGDRKAGLARGGDDRGARRRHQRERRRQPEGGEQRMGLGVAQHRALAGARALADPLRRGEVERLGLGLRRRHLEQPLLVAPIRGEKRERVDRILRREEIGDAAGFQRLARLGVIERAQPRREHQLRRAARGRRDRARRVGARRRRQRHVQREHGIGVGVGEDGADGLGDLLRRRVAADVERIVARALGRQHRVEPRHGVGA